MVGERKREGKKKFGRKGSERVIIRPRKIKQQRARELTPEVIYPRPPWNEIIKTPMIYRSRTIMSRDDTWILSAVENKYRWYDARHKTWKRFCFFEMHSVLYGHKSWFMKRTIKTTNIRIVYTRCVFRLLLHNLLTPREIYRFSEGNQK